MYAVEHALLNLGKNKGRNILTGAIIFAIVTSAVASLAIFNAAGAVIDETKAALMCAVRIVPARQASNGPVVSGGDRGAAAITAEQYYLFAESKFLDGADINENSRSPGGVDAVYYLKRPDMLADFEADLRGMGLPADYTVKTDESAFDRVVGPVESLKDLSFTFLIVVLLLGAVITALLSVISVRERKYEIGVLRAMGMKKNMVALSLWTEIIAITVICFVLGVCAGTFFSQPVSDAVLAGRANTAATKSTTLADRLNDNGADRFDSINISLSVVTALEIFAVSVALASISGVISAGWITKSEPIKILMERN